MDWAKIVAKFFGFLCGLIPGSVVMLVAALHRPDLWWAMWNIPYLGYQTKLAILVAGSFVAGHTINSVLGAITGGITSKVLAGRTQNAANLAYWLDPGWRNMVKAYLGKGAPEDLQPFLDTDEFQQAQAMAALLPQPEQARELFQIFRRSNDAQLKRNQEIWQAYWTNLHAVTAQSMDSPMGQALTLISAYGSASLVALLSLPWTPQLRQWWVVVPAIYFLAVNILEVATLTAQAYDPNQLFAKQWQYMRVHVAKGEKPGEQ